jgi:uncharacterized membrane protein YedE/YeeE
MNYLKYLLIGTLFGVVLSKGEEVSWYRIYEMFKFGDIHMYGVIGTAVVLGAIGLFITKRFKAKSFGGEPIVFHDKSCSVPRYLIGGTFFGLGWAMVGACPGPMFILVGQGYIMVLIIILGAVLGTFLYGLVRSKLPH